MRRPSGLDEAHLFSFYNIWSNDSNDFTAKTRTDLQTIREMPGVEDATVTLGLPLLGGGYNFSVSLSPDQPKGLTDVTLYPIDVHGLKTLGLHLVAGRAFNSEEIRDLDRDHENPESAPVVIVSQPLAQRIFPDGRALGHVIYLGKTPSTIVGIVERMQASHASTAESVAEHAVLAPFEWHGSTALYVVRARQGRRDALMQAVPSKLTQLDRARVITHLSSFEDTRRDAYRPLRGMALILGCISLVLIAIAGFGIVGLTSYWVSQRRRQIGIRRALGARRVDILAYFHAENLLVVGIGALIGMILTMATNAVVIEYFEMTRIPSFYILASVLIVLLLGQISVLWPAVRASNISPVLAIS
jgi:putative ABC transport system permease protein